MRNVVEGDRVVVVYVNGWVLYVRIGKINFIPLINRSEANFDHFVVFGNFGHTTLDFKLST